MSSLSRVLVPSACGLILFSIACGNEADTEAPALAGWTLDDTSENPEPQNNEVLNNYEFFGEFHHTFCRVAFECESPSWQMVRRYGRFNSVEECLASEPFAEPTFDFLSAQSRAAQDAGRLIVFGSEEDLEVCRQESFEEVCRGFSVEPTECAIRSEGTVGLGEPCVGFGECANGTCSGSVPNECYNTCEPYSPCRFCTEDEICVEGSEVGTQVCMAAQKLGESCSSAPCVNSLLCSEAEICVLPYQTPVGERCALEEECVQGSHCFSGVCTSITLLNLNEPCSRDSYFSFCRAGTVCADVVNGVGTCEPPRTRDEPCEDSSECHGDLACQRGVCGDLKPNGVSCSLSGECVSKFCTQGECVATEIPDVCPIP